MTVSSHHHQQQLHEAEFGKPLIENVLAGLEPSHWLVDTSQAYIPFPAHRPCSSLVESALRLVTRVRAVMGKRGESGTPEDPAHGRVWSSIAEGWDTVGFENEVRERGGTAACDAGQAPLEPGRGGAAELKERNGATGDSQTRRYRSRNRVRMHDSG